ncbi:hypothetical protein FISHEDRAFT_59033 [Fistulina hepatica ATCC 64428]|uniref:Uncharacterized protein n=1 Tax=Fistulina hepatica ATCC 64428 TaxID=1128425 RepID=A0A0D7AB20_9AGAR|nr:hypothetical protein FISHEDRAFT_59033 [Fistulina hepatica ATCC 64428]
MSSSPLLPVDARDLRSLSPERRRARQQECQKLVNRLKFQLARATNELDILQRTEEDSAPMAAEPGDDESESSPTESTNDVMLASALQCGSSSLNPATVPDESCQVIAAVHDGAGRAIPESTPETPKNRGLPAHRLQGKDKEAVVDGMWIRRRCALLHGKGGIELAHLVAFSISNKEREQLERALGIMAGGLNINTRDNLIEVCQTVHGLIDGQYGVLIPRDKVASRVMKISPPNPPLRRYEDLPYLDGERDAVREYFYVSLDRKDDIHEDNLIMGRTVITPNPRVVYEKALQDSARNASLGFVRLSDLPGDFSLAQPVRREQVSAWTTMPRAYLNANPIFVMLNAGRTLWRLDPARDLLQELTERFTGTDDELYIDEVHQVFNLCRTLYRRCFPASDSGHEAEQRADTDSDPRDASYIPRHNSPPSSDTQDSPPNSSPLAPVRTQNPYKEKLRKNRPEEGTFRESSIDAEPLDFTRT